MKLIHGIVAAGVASVLPTASADERAKEPRPFAIAFASEVSPVAYEEVRYPSYAGARNLSGNCEVTFAISATGEPDAIRVGACSSDAFRSAAKTTLQAMTFARRDALAEGVQMEIRWTLF